MSKYWLHRISHKSEASYPLLLQKGYLSIGFSKGFSNEEFLGNLNGFKNMNQADKAWQYFEKVNEKYWGLPRTRYNLWRFLYEFEEGDYVLVPMYKTFSLYEIIGKAKLSGQLEEGIVSNNITIEGDGENLLYNGQAIDLGFLIPVKLIEENISRNKYADSSLISRMKIRQTNADISDLKEKIEDAKKRARLNKPISLYSEIIDTMKEVLITEIREKLEPNKFESLIAWYLDKIGADQVKIPSKNEAGKSEYADADIVADFELLKLILAVQAKHHKGTTSSWAVEQIDLYKKDLQENIGDDYSYLNWVISSADDFSEEAISLAKEREVRLINGSEFAEMLIKAGLDNIDQAFNGE
ncbi:MAG: restriction endonuclease [Tissierellia bacterium]|nr:restriction endonuclease [Tissierellia bacterium]